MRRLVGIVMGLTLTLTLALATAPAGARAEDPVDPDDTAAAVAAARAAEEIADARARANDAADALFQTESRLDQLELDQQEIVRDIADLEAQIALLQSKVEGVAVNRFTRAGASSMPLLTGFEHAGELAQVDVLIDVVNETSAEDFDEFEALNADLAGKQQELNDAEARTIATKEEFERRRQAAILEVAHLKAVEADRLQDEAVRRALEAEEAERRRAEETQRRAEAVAAARAAVTPLSSQDSSSRRTTAAPAAAESNEMVDGDAGDAGPSSGATGGAGGGQTGNDGLGGRSHLLQVEADYGFEGWLCPVAGVVFFGDTWGAPRSGGRLHQGVDMIGQHGLPLVAVVDGFVQQKTNELGGKVVWLTGADGIKYYYAHLDEWDASGAVTAGTVIGYMGQTGNAQFSVPHLHFQIHPGGGVAVNPYTTVRAHC